MRTNEHSDLAYDSKERFVSYWHQINEIIKLNPNNILEIGVGTRFVSRYLKERNFKIITADINLHLKSDLLANILNLPFKDKQFEAISCCQVLEHLPYEFFENALAELYRVSRSYVILSLPDASMVYPIFIKIPGFEALKSLIPVPGYLIPANGHDYHYWEIGQKRYPLKIISKIILQRGFTISKTFRPFEYYYHRFFILKKTEITEMTK